MDYDKLMIKNRHKIWRKKGFDLNQKELEKLLKENGINKSQSAISNWDQGKNLPTNDVLHFYCQKGLNLNWLFTGNGSMEWESNTDSVPLEDQLASNQKKGIQTDTLKRFFAEFEKLSQFYNQFLELDLKGKRS